MLERFRAYAKELFPDMNVRSEYLCSDGITYMFKDGKDVLHTVIYNLLTKQFELVS